MKDTRTRMSKCKDVAGPAFKASGDKVLGAGWPCRGSVSICGALIHSPTRPNQPFLEAAFHYDKIHREQSIDLFHIHSMYSSILMTLLSSKDVRVVVLVVLAALMFSNGSPASIPRERRVGEGWIINGIPMSIDHVAFNR